jgi:uncharacterized membrane protein
MDQFLGWLVPVMYIIFVSAIIILFCAALAMLRILRNEPCNIPIVGKIAQRIIQKQDG